MAAAWRDAVSRPAPWAVRLAVMATAFATLAYEISLTRIFSVLFRAPYVFLILSIAICGLGLGSYLAARLDRPEADAADELAWPALAFAWLLPLPILGLLTVGRGLIASANGPAVALFTLPPYLAAGLLLARAFRRHASQAGRLYAFDLGGAGLAALVTLPLLAATGGLGVPLLLGALASLPAAWLAARARSAIRSAGVASAVLLLGLAVWQVRGGVLDLPPVTSTDSDRAKPLFQELADPTIGVKVLQTVWSPVARTDVVSNAGTDTLYIYTDGDVPTQMEPFKGDLATMWPICAPMINIVPFILQPEPERVLSIGPGGGLDVLLALLAHAKAIEPVELNPGIVDVTEQFKGFYGDLYRRPEVQPGLIIDEGRSYLSRAEHDYNLIFFALAKSATTQQGGVALVDSYLYTEEAFGQYLDHLAPGGLLAMVMQEPHLVDRNLLTAVSCLTKRGLTGADILQRVAWLEVAPEMAAYGPYRQLLLIRNGPFDEALSARLRGLAAERALQVRLLPGEPPAAPYDMLLAGPVDVRAYAKALSDAYGPVREFRGGPYIRLDFSPVTDDLPFYADLSPGLHHDLAILLRGAVLAGLVALLLAFRDGCRERRQALPAAGMAGYFGLLGGAYLLVEVALIQKLVLVLGYPTLSLTVILFSLLLGSALGGLMANRGTPMSAVRRLGWLVPLLVLGLGGFAAGVGPFSAALLTAPLPVRCVAVGVVVGLLGFLMGQPFPTGLRQLGAQSPRLVATAWAVNGVLSVTGSVLAASIASMYGYRAVLWTGAGLYLIALLALQAWARPAEESLSVSPNETPLDEECPDGGDDPGGRGRPGDGQGGERDLDEAGV